MRIAFSCDDGHIDQYKWARYLHDQGIHCTFFVNPFSVGDKNRLTLNHLKIMRNDWGHTIANHLWIHEAPACLGGILADKMAILKADFLCAQEWLNVNGFNGSMMALPYGSEGGKWTEKYVEMMLDVADSVRDYGTGIITDKYKSRIITSYEYQDINDLIDNTCICLHDSTTTPDDVFMSLVEGIKDKCNKVDLVKVENLYD